MKPLDLRGLVFGRLTVLSEHDRPDGRLWWLCTCSCGSLVVVAGSKLRNTHTQSCGCMQRERTGKAATRHGLARVGSKHPLYDTWSRMKDRCHNQAARHYRLYGARGITVCDRWRGDFAMFLADVGDRPAAGMSIDRINNDGNYEPANVRWATPTEQANNKRRWGSARSVDNG